MKANCGTCNQQLEAKNSGLFISVFKFQWLLILKLIWRTIVNHLTPSHEPVIRELVDRHGVTSWMVYDPIRGKSIRFNSPDEICVWIEERYFRAPYSSSKQWTDWY